MPFSRNLTLLEYFLLIFENFLHRVYFDIHPQLLPPNSSHLSPPPDEYQFVLPRIPHSFKSSLRNLCSSWASQWKGSCGGQWIQRRISKLGLVTGLWVGELVGGWSHGPLQRSPETAELPGQRKVVACVLFLFSTFSSQFSLAKAPPPHPSCLAALKSSP